jgi:replicative DNA helicase
MPILKTKDWETPIATTDVLHLILPAMYVNAYINHVPSRRMAYRVRHWDFEAKKSLIKSFETLEEAELFKARIVCTDVTRLRLVVTVADVLADLKYFEKHYRLEPQVIEYEAQDVPLPHRFVGIWLGDGHSERCAITTADTEIVEYITDVATSFELNVRTTGKYGYVISYMKAGATKRPGYGSFMIDRKAVDAALKDIASGMECEEAASSHGMAAKTLRRYKAIADDGQLDDYYDSLKINPMAQALRDLGVWNNKHIPKCYLENSRQARLELLAGIIDTDGHASGAGYDICFKSKRLLTDVITLARSLGFTAKDARYCPKTCTNAPGGPKQCEAYRSFISGGDLHETPVLLARKKLKPKTQRYDLAHFKMIDDPSNA